MECCRRCSNHAAEDCGDGITAKRLVTLSDIGVLSRLARFFTLQVSAALFKFLVGFISL